MQKFNIGETVNYNFREAVVVNTLPDDYYVFRYAKGNEPLYGCAHERFLCKLRPTKPKSQVRREAYVNIMEIAKTYEGIDPVDADLTKFTYCPAYDTEIKDWMVTYALGMHNVQSNFTLPVFISNSSCWDFIRNAKVYLERFRTGIE